MGPISELHFIRPGWLFALVLLVPLLLVGLRRLRSAGAWRTACDAHLLPHLMTPGGGRARHWPLALAAAGWIATCLALAGPAWERLAQPAYRAPAQRVFALNLSPSMDARDVAPSRVARARYELGDALVAMGDGQAGLVIFAEEAYVVTPISDDPKVVSSFLPVLETSLMPGRGVRVDRAIDEAVGLLEQAAATEGAIVLVTDSAGDQPEAAMAAARRAARAGYPVSVLALGTEAGAPVPTPRGFARDARGQAALAKLDLGSLEDLAEAGGGRLVLPSAGDDDLASVLDLPGTAFASGQSIADSGQTVDSWKDMGIVLVWLVALLAPLAFRRGWATSVALVAAIGAGTLFPEPASAGLRDWMWRADQLGAEAFEAGRHEEAADLFEDPAWRAASLYREGRFDEAAATLADRDTPGDRYNLGNALAQAGQLEAALAAYDQVLADDPADDDAQHNRDLVARLLEEQKQQQQPPPQQDPQPGEPSEQDPDSQDGTASDAPSDASGEEGESGAADASGDPSQEDSPESGDDDAGGDRGDPQSGGESQSDAAQADAGGAASPPDSPGSEGDEPSASPASARAGEPDGAEAEADDSGAARADAASGGADEQSAAAAQAVAEAGPAEPGEPTDAPRGPASDMASQPLSEREQAVEQWLNRVSDDPGGLLREKLRRRYARKRNLDAMGGQPR